MEEHTAAYNSPIQSILEGHVEAARRPRATEAASPLLNVLSVDVEEYFQVEAFSGRVPVDTWKDFPPRVERSMARILELFAKHGAKATFFVLGWIAQQFPNLVKGIAAAGHEVGCHGNAHRPIFVQKPDEFRTDLQNARDVLADLVQQPIRCYRAPSFSIVRNTLWAFDILAEEGFAFDSSVFPVRHDVYGIPDAQRFPHWYFSPNGNRIFEFPPSTVRRFNNNWGVGGGGYLRFIPYSLTQRALRQINSGEKQPAMVYFHPWEIDPEQPRISAGLRSTLRHYTYLSSMEGKIEHLLNDFRFAPLTTVCSQLTAYQSLALPKAAAAGQGKR
jgi:polysaccharide deacetylase family protein (PEP-CTERM system associated)